jgi:signal transduction histidine kinase
VLVGTSIFIYYFSYKFAKEDFFIRLQEKADFISQKYFEEDELSKKIYQEIIEKNIRSIPDANEMVFNINNPGLLFDSLQQILPRQSIVKLLSGKNITFSIDDKQGIGIYYPDNQGTFVIIVTAVDKIGQKELKTLLNILVRINLISVLFIYFIGLFYSHRILFPLSHILKRISRIRATNLKLRLQENNDKDELGELTRTFNQMLERLDHSFDLQRNFIHNASHELKNPLTAILGETEVTLSKIRSQEEYIVTLNKIAIEADRLYLLIRNLLNMTQADFELSEHNSELIRIDELLKELKEYFENTDYRDRIAFSFSKIPSDKKALLVNGISNLLKTAFINLIDNACKFSDNQLVHVTLHFETDIVITIIDKGIGIPEEELSNLFQPFFRASNTFQYKGSGIGLSLTEKIIKLHAGTITFFSSRNNGTKVEIRFKPVLES